MIAGVAGVHDQCDAHQGDVRCSLLLGHSGEHHFAAPAAPVEHHIVNIGAGDAGAAIQEKP